MNPLDGITSRLIGTPLLLTAEKAQEIYGALEFRMFGGLPGGEAPETLARIDRVGAAAKRPGLSQEKSVAVIDISGTLVNKAGGMMAASGLRSYKGIEGDILEAATDDSVGAIVLRIDSPGGEVVGIDGVTEAIRQARTEKPVIAVIESRAASAAYWIASQADRIVAEKNSLVGSIGAIAIHVDHSKENEKKGRTVTIMRSAENKALFNGEEPLPKAQIEKVTAMLVKIRGEFEGEVFSARAGRIDEKAVRALKSDTVDAETGFAIGLVDEIGSFRSVMAELFASADEAAEEEEVPAFSASAQAAVTTPTPNTEEPMEKEITAAAGVELSADQKASILRGAIDAACEANPRAREIQAALVKCGAEQNDCQRIAQIYHLSTRGADDAFKTKLQAMIAPGITAEKFNAKLNELEMAADAAAPTQAAIVGTEGLKAGQTHEAWSIYDRINARNKASGYKPSAEEQSTIDMLTACR